MSAEQVATNWVPGLMMLGAGAAGALAYLLGSKRLQGDLPRPETVDDLDARYQALLGELRQHGANQHLVPAAEFEREQTRLELAAAEILRARDGRRHEDLKKQARAEQRAAIPPTLAAKRPVLRGALVGGALVAFFVLVGWQLAQTAIAEPDDPQPSALGPGAAPPADPVLEVLAAGVQARPHDVEAVAALSLHLLLVQAFDDARPLVQRATQLDPVHPKAQVGQAVVRGLDGDVRGSLDELEGLAVRYPQTTEALLFAGLMAMDTDQPRALRNLEAYVQRAPRSEQPPLVHLAVAQLRGRPRAGAP